jgi:hypothetical protein
MASTFLWNDAKKRFSHSFYPDNISPTTMIYNLGGWKLPILEFDVQAFFIRLFEIFVIPGEAKTRP